MPIPTKKKVVVPPTPKDAAAMVIQKFCRYRFGMRTTHRLVCNLIDKIKLTPDHVKSISFESLVVMLREKPVIQAAKAALQRIHLLATFRHGSPSRSLAPENVNVRVFMAAFMIAIRPTHVFESMGTLEQSLFESAMPLLSQFQTICSTLKSAPFPHFQCVPSDQTKDFPTALFEYLKRFKAWKVPDEAKLTCRIKHALVALYQARDHLPPDEPEDSKLKVEFRTQIERLREKLRQIAGVEAVNELDAKLASGEIGSSSPPAPAGEAYASLPGRMTNEQLAHELLLDNSFQLHDTGGMEDSNPVFYRIRESFHKAFWDSLVDDLKLAVPCYVRVLRVLKEIHDGIVDLAGNRELGSIGEVIDVDYIKDRAEKGAYSFEDAKTLFHGAYAIILRVQAPKRDAETKEKWGVVKSDLERGECWAAALCKGLEFMLDRVNAMRIDAANTRLRLIAPVIKDHGIDYERGKFADKVHDGTITPERTVVWLAGELDKVADFSARLHTKDIKVSAGAAIELHAWAMVSLITVGEEAEVRLQGIPETLAFDLTRINDFRREFKFVVTAKSVLAVLGNPMLPTKQIATAAAREEARRDAAVRAQKGLDYMIPLRQSEDIDVALLPYPDCPDQANLLKRSVKSNMATDGAVRMLFRARLQKYIRCRITGEETEHNPLSLPSPLLERAEALVKRVTGVAKLNREVHAPFYNNIFAHIADNGQIGIDRVVRESFPPRAGRA